jgi:menaquinone-9 beta-reductase
VSSERFDVVIAGAGPAGAAAACYFARAGFDVALVDERRFPRDKVCGDFVGPRALAELDRLDLSSDPTICEANTIGNAAMYLSGNQLVERRLPSFDGLRGYGLCIPRVKLDAAIARAAVEAGANLIEETRIIGYETDTSGVTVWSRFAKQQRSIRARLLIGADGSASLIARTLRGAPAPKYDRIVAVRAYFDDVRGPADRADLYLGSAVFPGYFWIFPTGAESANVGVGMLLETWPSRRPQLAETLRALIRSDPAIEARLGSSTMRDKIAGWPLVTYNPQLPVAADRVVLLGDAASLINPLNGEGIQYALQSARWCFETMHDGLCLDRLSAAALSPYADRVRGEMQLDMAAARLLVDLIRNRALAPLWLAGVDVIGTRATLDGEYADLFGGVLAGIVPTQEIVAVSFALRTLRQAFAMSGRASTPQVFSTAFAMARSLAMNPAAAIGWITQVLRDAFRLTIQAAAPRQRS